MAGVPASGMVGISVAIALQATAIAAQGVQAGQVGEPTMMPSWPHTEFGQREFPDRGRLHVASRCAVPTRHRTSDPRPVVELLLGRAALPRALGCGTIQQVGGEAGHPISGFGVSARREIVAVNEHQVAVAKPHRPPARRVYDVMLTDIHPLAGAVAESSTTTPRHSRSVPGYTRTDTPTANRSSAAPSSAGPWSESVIGRNVPHGDESSTSRTVAMRN
jgi:hypothetical protein